MNAYSSSDKTKKMQTFTCFAFLYLITNAEAQQQISVKCGADIRLQCSAEIEKGVIYRSIRWYKVLTPDLLNGIVYINMNSSMVKVYNGFKRSFEFTSDDVLSLIMKNSTEEDGGTYQCFLSAPLGQQSRKGEIQVKILGCSKGQIESILSTCIYLMTALLSVTLIAFILIIHSNYKKYHSPYKELLLTKP
ncbi:CD83 antigen-like [Erpetoichthys calabaricus]|uniref:CD83 antigen-like n=1 Tax=Erpetoichthys calabaricus TaxID=27687 RepID=A0A8C4RNM8_ERPCA|nr:CD83 antigen-like [Erpetoichthys calabaricus]